MDQIRDAIRVRQYSIRTEEAYTQWIRRSIFFHNKKHPGIWVNLNFPVSDASGCG